MAFQMLQMLGSLRFVRFRDSFRAMCLRSIRFFQIFGTFASFIEFQFVFLLDVPKAGPLLPQETSYHVCCAAAP